MAFQDFDQIQSRVNAERKRKLKKRIIIGVVSALVVVAAMIGGAFAYVTYENKTQVQGKHSTNTPKKDSSSKESPSQSETPSPKTPTSAAQTVKPDTVSKIVQTLCNSTLYKPSCESTLKNGTKPDTPLKDPRSLLETSFEAVNEDLKKVLEKVTAMKTENQDDKDAIAQCKALVDDAKEELIASMNRINNTEVTTYAKIAPGLASRLSAVMSYQETCIDGFEEGPLKTDMRKNFNSSQALTSNSLAMIKSLGAYLSAAPTRNLLDTITSAIDESLSNTKEGRMLKAIDVKTLKPNATVAKDGSGNFTTINDALKAMPATYQGRYLIYIKQGVYDESVVIDKKKTNVTMVGDGSQKTIVTGNKSNAKKARTVLTATFVVQGHGFMANSMGFRNTAGPEAHQAVAIRVQSDRSIFQNCRFEGYRNTLHAYTHRQYYKSCVIIGTTDFIFGDASAIFQSCDIFIRKGVAGQKNTVTAQGRVDKFQTTGFVLHKCTIAPFEDLKPVKADFKSYLGRPPKNHSRTIVMESTIEDVIDPAGWLRWQETDFAINTLFYGEYKNVGPSGKTDSRVKWPGFKVMSKEVAMNYTVGPFLQGEWIQESGAPVKLGLYEA